MFLPDFPMKVKITGYRFCLLILIACSGLVQIPVSGEQSALDAPHAVAPYLNSVFPSAEPGSAERLTHVNAYPNLYFTDPIWVVPYPDSDDLVVCEQNGRIFRFPDREDVEASEVSLMLDWSAKTHLGDGRGLYSLIFHPEFGMPSSPNRNYVYVCYNHVGSFWRVTRFTIPDGSSTIDPGSETVLINQSDVYDYHNGGAMFFDTEGYLYISAGDGGIIPPPEGFTQVLDQNLFSGILRIDVDMDLSRSHPIRRQPLRAGSFTQNYTIPDSNPFVQDPAPPEGQDADRLEEFYAIGLRSPHTMTYDPLTGEVWIGDVGQTTREELDRIVIDPENPVLLGEGPNFQWAYKEGFVNGPLTVPDVIYGVETPPIYDYDRSVGFAVICGFRYEGTELPSLQGKLIYGENIFGKIFTLDYTDIQEPVSELVLEGFPTGRLAGMASIRQDAHGEILIPTVSGGEPNGTIRKLTYVGGGVEPPSLLSQTGAFKDTVNLIPADFLVPYEVNAPLWSDGAAKRRWIALPNDGVHDSASEKITFDENDNWEFPEGTVFIKHFELPLDPNDPFSNVRLETRFIVCLADGKKYGVTYRWYPDQTDAYLLTEGETGDYFVKQEDGSLQLQTWQFPSRGDCLLCHGDVNGHALGVRTHQINRDNYYPLSRRRDNQLHTWSHLGMFDSPLSDDEIENLPKSYALADTSVSLDLRARSYLAANCSHCHQPGGVGGSFDARLSVGLREQNLVNGELGQFSLGEDGRLIRPGDMANSAIHVRMAYANPDGNAMPPLAKNVVDETAVELMRDWILSLEPDLFSDPPTPQPIRAILTGPRDDEVKGDFEVILTLDGRVTDLEATDFAVSGGTLQNLSGSGDQYVGIIRPSGPEVTIRLPAATVTAENGQSNLESNMLVVNYEDTTHPVAYFTDVPPDSEVDGPFSIGLSFGEPVSGFDEESIVVTNGTLENLTGADGDYRLYITPDPDIFVIIELVPDGITDNHGNSMLLGQSISLNHLFTNPFIEAEEGDLFGAFVPVSDAEASGGAYIWMPDESVTGGFNVMNRAEFTFELPYAGMWRVQGLVRSDSGGADSFFVEIDGNTGSGPVYIWDTNAGSVGNQEFQWDDISQRGGSDPLVFNLTAGTHTVVVYGREDGTRIDSLRMIIEGIQPKLTGPVSPVTGNYVVSVRFPEIVVGLSVQDFSVIDGEAISLTGSGAVYYLTVEPDGDSIQVMLPSDSVTNLGETPNFSSNVVTVNYVDAYILWAGLNGVSGFDADPFENPDGDAYPNYFEFLTGQDPQVFDGFVPILSPENPARPMSGLPVYSLHENAESAWLRVRFMRRKSLPSAGWETEVEYSESLLSPDWDGLPVSKTIDIDNEWEWVEVLSPTTDAEDGSMFIRMKYELGDD